MVIFLIFLGCLLVILVLGKREPADLTLPKVSIITGVDHYLEQREKEVLGLQPGVCKEVIWAGNDQVGFHTSHLTRISGTNTGSSRYGNATGKTVNFFVIANCVALQNDIFLEHVLYNTSAMLQQLGIGPWEEATRLVKDPPAGWPRSQENWINCVQRLLQQFQFHKQSQFQDLILTPLLVKFTIMFGMGISQQFQIHMQRICSSRARLSVPFLEEPLIEIM